jgi:ribosome-associated translation inhibitor RaiA
MMGKKKLSEVRAEVQAALDEAGIDLERELRKLQRKRKPNPREIETLKMLQRALAKAAVEHAR